MGKGDEEREEATKETKETKGERDLEKPPVRRRMKTILVAVATTCHGRHHRSDKPEAGPGSI